MIFYLNKFTANELKQELARVGNAVKTKTRAYLIGGCSMSLRGLKPSTKDVDLVFSSKHELDSFAQALEELGYSKILETSDEYTKLAASMIYRKEGSAGFDLFLNIVCKTLYLSNEMKERAEKFGDFGLLEIFLCSEEDVFVFKSVTERPLDVDDAASLIEAKLDKFDWEAVKKEIEAQTLCCPDLPTLAFNKTVDLKEKHEILTPINSWLRKKSNEAVLRHAFNSRLEDGMTKEQALEDLKKMKFTKKELAFLH